MRTLVITSCTAKKSKSPGYAGVFYSGMQHLYTLDGLRTFRDLLGPQGIDLNILSAKYGLLGELDYIEPYDVTFKSMSKNEILEVSTDLQINEKLSDRAQNYDLVIYLLGKEYVQAMRLPLACGPNLTHIFLLGALYHHLLPARPDYHFIPAGGQLSQDLGVQTIALKGYVFKKLGEHANRLGDDLILERIRENPQVLQGFLDGLVAEKKEVKQLTLF